MNPAEESAYWNFVASSSIRIDAEVYGDLNLADCLGAITPHLEMAGWILELGCGPGRLTRQLAVDYPQVRFVGVDSSPLMIDLASQLEPRVHWVVNDGRTLDLTDGKFQSAYSMTTFQHIPHEAQQGYLEELHRVVKSGGKLRLQFVTDSEPGPMNHPITVKQMLVFADAAGWRDTDLNLGVIRAEWAWLTLVKL